MVLTAGSLLAAHCSNANTAAGRAGRRSRRPPPRARCKKSIVPTALIDVLQHSPAPEAPGYWQSPTSWACGRSWNDLASGNLPLAVAVNVSAVMPDVAAVVAHIAMIGSQVAVVIANVTSLLARSGIVAIANVIAQLVTVLSDVTLVVTDVAPVLPAVHSVVMQVAAVVSNIWSLGQSYSRAQQCKHQQSNNSSSHIASLVSGPLRPLGR